MIDKDKAQRLVGESIRDIGILIVVFGPLDALFEQPGPGGAVVTLMVAGGLILITLGIIVETKE